MDQRGCPKLSWQDFVMFTVPTYTLLLPLAIFTRPPLPFSLSRPHIITKPEHHRFYTTDLMGSQFSSVSQSCPTLRDPMDCSTPGLPVHPQLLELTQTRVHRVSDAIQPSHPLSSPSPPAFSLWWVLGTWKNSSCNFALKFFFVLSLSRWSVLCLSHLQTAWFVGA